MSAPLTSVPSGTQLLPRLYAHAAGPLSATYYRHHFERMEAHSRPLATWNHAAAFNTLAWLCLRRMWLAASIYAAAMALLWLLVWAVVWPLLGGTAAWATGVLLAVCSVVVPGLWGNQLYYQHLRARTLHALQASDTIAQAQAQLGALAITEQRRNTTAAVQAAVLVLLAGAGLSFSPAPPPAAPAANAPSGPPVLHFPSSPQPTPDPEPAPAPEATPVAAPAAAIPTPTDVVAPAEPVAITAPLPAAAPAAPQPLAASPAATTTAAVPVHAAKTAGTAAPSGALVPGRFYLNAGVFSQSSNADKAEKMLRQAGLPVLRSKVLSAKGEVVRLRSGPFETAAQARAAQRTVAQQQLEATVFQHRSGS